MKQIIKSVKKDLGIYIITAKEVTYEAAEGVTKHVMEVWFFNPNNGCPTMFRVPYEKVSYSTISNGVINALGKPAKFPTSYYHTTAFCIDVNKELYNINQNLVGYRFFFVKNEDDCALVYCKGVGENLSKYILIPRSIPKSYAIEILVDAICDLNFMEEDDAYDVY